LGGSWRVKNHFKETERRAAEMKKALLIFLVVAFCAVLSYPAECQELKAQPKACEYTGTITGKFEKPDRITLAAQGGPKEFNFKHSGKNGCLSFMDLTIGDNVNVSCEEKKDHLEAICVKKIVYAPFIIK
jgi:hypothetical protein